MAPRTFFADQSGLQVGHRRWIGMRELLDSLVHRVLRQGRPRAHVAAEMGISRQCASRWIARYLAEGEPGLRDRSSRPHRLPTRTAAAVESRVLAVRARQRRGQGWIGPEVGIPARTVSRILRRHRVAYLRELTRSPAR